MTIAWHDGQYIRQEHTRADIEARRNFISSSDRKVEEHSRDHPWRRSRYTV